MIKIKSFHPISDAQGEWRDYSCVTETREKIGSLTKLLTGLASEEESNQHGEKHDGGGKRIHMGVSYQTGQNPIAE